MSIPVGTKFIGIAADVDTYERKSAQANSPSNVYTIEEIVDGSVPDTRTITINGTTQDLSADRTYSITDANLSTSDITTNNVSIAKHGFAPKAPNDISQFLSGDGTWRTINTGITVGTTAVTLGTNGRVFFQAGGVVQQDGAFNWDNTNKRLGIGANATSPSATLFVRNNVATANDPFIVQNGYYGDAIFRVRDNNTGSAASTGQFFMNGRIYGSNSTVTGKELDLGGFGLGASYGDNGSNAVWLNNQGNVGDGAGTSVISVTSNFYVNLQTTKKYKFEAVTGHFGIGNVGTLGARLDVRAQGALSTDIAFRVRNSADTADIFSVRGNNDIYVPIVGNNAVNTIYTGVQSLLRYSNENFQNVQLGIGSSISPTDYYQTVIGGGNTSNGGANIVVGVQNNTGTANQSFIIGNVNRLVNLNSYVIRIGSAVSNQYFGGANSIHIGRFSGAPVSDLVADNLFQMYFNDRVPSLVGTGNGTFGLIQDSATTLSYIYNNTSKTAQLGTGGNTLVVANHTNNPSTNLVDKFQLYSADITAGNAAPHFRTENGSIVKLYQETTGVAASTFVANTSGILNDTATFDGYTIGQVVKALRNLGILA